jgi:hypothetical protein
MRVAFLISESRGVSSPALVDMTAENADVAQAVWHFVGGRTGSLGADSRVLDLLDQKGVAYVIHLP